MSSRFQRSDVALLVVALACGALFVASLHRLWPLGATNVNLPPERVIAQARTFLAERGLPAERMTYASRLEVDDEIMEYLLRAFGRERTQQLIAGGTPVYLYRVFGKERGDPDSTWVALDARKGVLAWNRTVQEDAAGASLTVELARSEARRFVEEVLRVPLAAYAETGHSERDRIARRDHVFTFETWLSRAPELRERITVAVSGSGVTGVQRGLVLPDAERRNERRRQGPVTALQVTGLLLVAAAAFAALVVFLTSLQAGDVRLKQCARWVGIIAIFFLITQALQPADLLQQWDPLWPRWIASLQSLGFSLANGAWIAFALFIVIAAGDALDRRSGANRGDAFWRAGKGRLLDRDIGLASCRGFLVGLICGGVLVGTLLLLEQFGGAWVSLQPRGFFFFAINSSVPALSTLLYFLMVALIEELGYRFFAGTWLLMLTKRRWIAIVIPAILYGTSHTGLDFLPPVEPFWGRALALTAVGCVWGWAFFRYDALTVVLSHFTADLFIFNWARLGSGDPVLVAKAIATISVPLLPALLLLRPRRLS